jgi:hypothetical protein
MSYTDYLKRLKVNSPVIIDRRMSMPDASSYTWRKKLETSRVFDPTTHVITNVFDPGHSPVFNRKQIVSYKGTGFGGRVQDASTYTLTKSATAIGRDVFTLEKIQTNPKNVDGECLVRTPASQIVGEQGNADGNKIGLNMGYVSDCTPIFRPLTKSHLVDTIPEIKTRKVGYGRIPTRTGQGSDYGQNPLVCSTTSTTGTQKSAADPPGNEFGIADAKDLIPANLHSPRPLKNDFFNNITGPQVGGGNMPGQRAPKVGGALRKIPNVQGQHGFAGYSPTVPTPFVPPANAPAHLKINSPNHYVVR